MGIKPSGAQHSTGSSGSHSANRYDKGGLGGVLTLVFNCREKGAV
jgi:hypothetical protein